MESEAEGRKLETEEYNKSSKFLIPSFEKPITSSSTRSLELPASVASLLESEVGLSTNSSQDEEEVKLDKSTYEEIKSQAARENVDMTEGPDDGGRGEFIDEIYLMSLSVQNLVNINWMVSKSLELSYEERLNSMILDF